MNDIPRQKLQYIISQFGRVICDEPRRCEAMLRDLCPENRLEINLLTGAARERVAADLMTASDAVPKEILLARLARRLCDNLGVREDFCTVGGGVVGIGTGMMRRNSLQNLPK